LAGSFAGFPDGPLAATVVPSLFIAEAMGSIDNLAELKLMLYLFWRLNQKRPAPRFLRLSDLDSDSVIREGLASASDGTLEAALDRLIADSLILRRAVQTGERRDEFYFLNTSAGRRAVRYLEAGTLDRGVVAIPEEPLRPDRRSSIFHLYEQNVGMVTPLIVDELTAAERDYPGEWVEEAFREAVRYNRRSWSYVQGILRRWAVEGKGDNTTRRRTARSSHPSSGRGGL
jgi:DnaD/phage-associated family protein